MWKFLGEFRRIFWEIPDEIFRRVPELFPSGIPEQISSGIPQGISRRNSGEIPEGIFEGFLGGISG